MTGIHSTRATSGSAHAGMHSERRRISGTANPSAGTIHTSAPKPRKYAIGIPSVSGMIGHAGVDERARLGARRGGHVPARRPASTSPRLGDERFGEGGHAAPFTSPSMSVADPGDAGGRRRRCGRSGTRAAPRATASSAAHERGLVVGERDEVAAGHEVGERALVVVDVLAEARPARDDDRAAGRRRAPP